jgi:hypothetical protein
VGVVVGERLHEEAAGSDGLDREAERLQAPAQPPDQRVDGVGLDLGRRPDGLDQLLAADDVAPASEQRAEDALPSS